MGYYTPTWVRPTGFYNSDGDFVRTGSYEMPGVPLPAPGKHMPKPGHWRLTPGQSVKCHRTGTRNATTRNVMMAERSCDGDYINPLAHEHKQKSLRDSVRMAVAAGIIARDDAPSWAL